MSVRGGETHQGRGAPGYLRRSVWGTLLARPALHMVAEGGGKAFVGRHGDGGVVGGGNRAGRGVGDGGRGHSVTAAALGEPSR